MLRHEFSIWLFLMLFFITSCSGKHESKDFIKAGSHKGMKLNGEETTITPGGYYNFSTIMLDANQDGKNDFKFALGYWGSPGMGMRLHSSFSSEHDGALIYGETTSDTIFQRIMRTYGVDHGSGMIIAYTLTQSDCMKRSEEYFPASQSLAFHPIWLREGEIIGGTDDNFRRSSASFVYTDSWPPYTDFHNDTLWISRTENRSDCHCAPDGVPVYVGIALIEHGKIKKGWIRFRLEGSARITFLEMAFQR